VKPLNIIEQYKLLHDKGFWFRGTAIKGYVGQIDKVIKETDSKTLLDYGCGKAIYYTENKIHEGWGVKLPYLYDPGVRKHPVVKNYKPQEGSKFDGVICTDVLEHVEKPEEVIKELIGYASKFLFCTISCRDSEGQKKLLDGRGVHISVYPPEWWRERFIAPHLRVELRFDIEELGIPYEGRCLPR